MRHARDARHPRGARRPRRALVLLVGAVLLGGCDSDDGATTDPDIDVGEADDASDGEQAPDDASDDEQASDTEEAPDDASAGDGADGDADDGADPTAGDAEGELVATDVAEPGTWPVGDAGTVSFQVADGALVLEDHEAADGWGATVDEEDGDEIEVDFTQDQRRWEFEVEIDDGRLEVEIRQDHLDASAGSYDLPDDGSLAFDADGGLTLTDVSPGEGWDLVERDEESDEFEIDLRNGDRTVDGEVELDEGRIEVEIDYEVVGALPN